MSEKTLILLTKQFPYQHREQYVAHELVYLAKSFDRVFIYPHDHFGKEEKISFSLPENVEVIDLNRQIIPEKKIAVFKSFISAFYFEFFRTHSKWWLLKNAMRFYSIYATQFALGSGLERFIEQNKLDKKNIVYYSYWFSASALCLAILKSRKRISRFVSRAHALDLYHEDWGLLNEKTRVLPFRNFKQKYVDVIFSISNHGKKYLNKKYPSIREVEVNYLGVKDEGLNPESTISDGLFVIVTCSGIDDNKRIHLLGESLSRLNLPVNWIHFGDGHQKAMALKSVSSDLVQFEVKGQTPNAEIRKFYSEHHIDLFVNLSRVEGLPVTIMEALSHGIPVLATRANGTPEAVVDGITGKLVEVDFNTKTLDTVLNEIISNSGKLSSMRIEARKLFAQKFDADKNYILFADALTKY